ncbi:hypothetical protein PybrP1_007384 [[Pythium] brassicae (nom. inval.)]|nr:hypothetical protein PybrP1_007384 [[Pythium] brassicae (nom. inval.)]
MPTTAMTTTHVCMGYGRLNWPLLDAVSLNRQAGGSHQDELQADDFQRRWLHFGHDCDVHSPSYSLEQVNASRGVPVVQDVLSVLVLRLQYDPVEALTAGDFPANREPATSLRLDSVLLARVTRMAEMPTCRFTPCWQHLEQGASDVDRRRDQEAKAVAARLDEEPSEYSAAGPREPREPLERVPARALLLGHKVHQQRPPQRLCTPHHRAASQEERALRLKRRRECHRDQTHRPDQPCGHDHWHAAAAPRDELCSQRAERDADREQRKELGDLDRTQPELLKEEQREEVRGQARPVAHDEVGEEQDRRHVGRAESAAGGGICTASLNTRSAATSWSAPDELFVMYIAEGLHAPLAPPLGDRSSIENSLGARELIGENASDESGSRLTVVPLPPSASLSSSSGMYALISTLKLRSIELSSRSIASTRCWFSYAMSSLNWNSAAMDIAATKVPKSMTGRSTGSSHELPKCQKSRIAQSGPSTSAALSTMCLSVNGSERWPKGTESAKSASIAGLWNAAKTPQSANAA